MPSSKRQGSSPTFVTIVSNNPETLDGLHRYLEHAGVHAYSTRAIHDLDMVAPMVANAIVIFPDDFAEAAVVALLRELRRRRPRLLLLLVTRAPNQFRHVLHAGDRARAAVILPKPSFGWDILDAIRAQDEPLGGRAP
jgi:hypothetical protein